MESIHGVREQGDLLKVVRSVRGRWRLKHALRGAAITLAGAFVVYALTAIVVHALDYSETSVLAGRVVCIVALVALAIRFVVMPLLPKVQDERVALYLEEHEPTVEGAIFTSVEVDRALAEGNDRISPALAARLKSSAIERARVVGDGRRVDAAGVRNGWLLVGAVALVAALITTLGPAPLRNGLRLLATPWKPAEASTVFSIAVDPGNMTIAKGGDAEVFARLRNFQSEEVTVMARMMDSATWVRLPMVADSAGRYTARLLDIEAPTEYVVEANGIRSATYRIDVVNLPYVKNMNMEYRYPNYTGLPAEKFDSSGDIAALKGTLVTIEVEATMPTQGGQIVLDNGEKIRLTQGQGGALTATLRVDHTGFYKVELAGPDGSMVTGSLDYTIDMLVDRKPTVVFRKPGRDSRVMAVDEVYTEAEAKDDYGVSRLELVYSINGAPERTVPLSQATSRVLRDISAGYTFMLEDYELKPGDVVSYFARAVDNDAVSGAKSAETDIYFLNVAPYQRDYRQGQAPQGGGGGGGPRPEDGGQFSQRQRDIIAATFKSARDSSSAPPKTLSEDVQTIRLSEQKLREEVEGLGRRLVERGITAQDSNYAKIAKLMAKAGAIMDTAERALGAGRLTEARGPEQRALQLLMQAEAIFRDVTVQQQQQGGGGGGGGQQSEAQDLADLFELRQERMRNQYEEVNRGQDEQQAQQQQQQQQIDSLAQKLKELAQRQQTEDERARAKADSMNGNRQQQQGGGGGGGGRQAAQQAEDAARTLERLARERQSQALADAARALQNAADEMRRNAASGRQGTMSGEAQRQLEEARRLLDQDRRLGEQKNVNDALDQARQLKAEQQRVNNDVNRLNTADSAAARRDIAQRSGQMADRLRDLTQEMDRIARNVQSEQPAASRALRNAADSVRAARLESQIRAAQQMAGSNTPSNYLRDVTEPQISRGIDNLNRQLEQAQQAASAAQNQQAGAQSLDKVRDMVNGVESLAERVQQQIDRENRRRLTGGDGQGQEQGRQGQGAQGQDRQGQRGQDQDQQGRGQSGERGQAQGQQGQRQGQGQGQGQQGQRQQGQGQQGQGQQGQGQQGQGQQGQGQQGQGQQGQGQQGQGQQSQGRGQGQGQQGQGQGQGQGQQGRQGQQGEQGGRGEGRPGEQQGGMGGAGGNGSNFDPQFQRELTQRLADAEALRRELARQGRDVSQLDQAIQGLRGVSNLRSLSDERASRQLQTQVDALKNFEFQLARAINGDKEGVRVGRVGDVPPAYRAWVDEYYREIGKTPATKKPPL